eukprot:2899650-Amphidinium_carterae.1
MPHLGRDKRPARASPQQMAVHAALRDGTHEWRGWGARNLELAAKPSSRLAVPANFFPKQKPAPKPSSKPAYTDEEWQVWTGPQGWQDWSRREEAAWANRAESACPEGQHSANRTRGVTWADQAGSGSRPSAAGEEWVEPRLVSGEEQPALWGRGSEGSDSAGKGDRARRASPNPHNYDFKRHKSGDMAQTCHSSQQRAWSQQPARKWGAQQGEKKRPRSDPTRSSSVPTAWHNLRDVTVEEVDGEVQAFGPSDKAALGLAGRLLLLQGNRRGAQETLRSNERAINNRFQAQLPCGKATPAQIGRFAETKRGMPWDDDQTTRFIIHGEDPAMAASRSETNSQHLHGLGVPADLRAEQAQYRTRSELSETGGASCVLHEQAYQGLEQRQPVDPEPEEDESSSAGMDDPRDRVPQVGPTISCPMRVACTFTMCMATPPLTRKS